MKVIMYDYILAGWRRSNEGDGIFGEVIQNILPEVALTEQPMPRFAREHRRIGTVQIWHDFASDYFFFEELKP